MQTLIEPPAGAQREGIAAITINEERLTTGNGAKC
jgi:hypothetical protein